MVTRRTALSGIASAGMLAASGVRAELDLDRAFDRLVFGSDTGQALAIETLQERGGTDLIAGLIFAMRFTRLDDRPIVELMQDIAGEADIETWFDWMLWQEARPEIVPHPSHETFKRKLLLDIAPNFDIFLKHEHVARDRMKIRFEEVTWGGVRKDGSPSLDNPELIPGSEADYLVGSDFVFGISINGDTRAYPLRIMGWHEMFNDVIGGVPLALAYCTLCGSGILFETDLPDRERPLVFGSSGFLYRSNKLMFDRETHSLWNQFTDKPVSGPLVDSGIALQQRPVVIEPWVRWYKRNPDTKILSLNTGHTRNYGSGVVYDKYFTSPKLMFPTLVDQTKHRQKDYVFGIRTFGGAKAWPVTAFEGGRVINDSVADLNVMLIGDRLGRRVRAYARDARIFGPGKDSGEVLSGIETWNVTEEHLIGPNGERAPRVAGHVAYWFAWNGYLGAQSELYDG